MDNPIGTYGSREAHALRVALRAAPPARPHASRRDRLSLAVVALGALAAEAWAMRPVEAPRAPVALERPDKGSPFHPPTWGIA